MKKTTVIASLVFAVVLLLGAALIVPSFIDWSGYKVQAEEQILKTTGHRVALKGDLGLSILPAPYVYVQDVEVAAPQGSASPYLAKFKRLDISLALIPLLTGKAVFDSVSLDEPDIALQVFADGRENWMTPELQAMMAKDTQAAQQVPGQQKAGGQAVSLEKVEIKNGRISYQDKKSDAPLVISGITTDIRAETLRGPFRAEGKLESNGQALEFKAETGPMLDDEGSLALNLEADVKPGDLHVAYAGVVTTQAPFEVQGETAITVSSLPELLKARGIAAPSGLGKLETKGLLTASAEAFDYKNASIKIGDMELTGFAGAKLSPMDIKASLKSQKPVNLDSLLGGGGSPAKAEGDNALAQLNSILPETLTLPAAITADIAVEAPGMIYNRQTYNNVTIALKKADKSFTASIDAGEIPGKGQANAAASLNYAAKSVSEKTGAETYSEPSLSATVKAESQNIPQTLQALMGKTPFDFPADWKTGSISGRMKADSRALTIEDARLRVADTSAQLSGSFVPNAKGVRPLLKVDAAVDTLNLDKLAGGEKGEAKAQSQQDMAQTLQSLSFPYDVDFDVGVQSLKTGGKDIKGLRAQGSLKADSLKFANLSAQDYAGAAVKVEGGIGSLKNLSGIDLKINGQTSDAGALMKALGGDASGLPPGLKSANAAVTAKGDSAKLTMHANIRAMNGEVIASGDVATPLTSWTLSNLTIQAKHQNTNDALAIFAPSAPRYVSWGKPLDLFAQVKQQDKTYTLSGLKGSFAGTPVSGDMTLNTGGAKPDVKATLRLGRLEMQSAAAARQAAAGQGAQSREIRPAGAGGGRWSSEPMDTAWMHGFNADIDVQADSILYQNWDLQKPTLNLTLNNGALNIAKLETGLFGGTMAMNGSLSSTAAGGRGSVALDANAKLQNVNVEPLVKAFVGSYLIQGKGIVSMDMAVKGSGVSQAALVSSLSGNGNVSGKSIVLEGIDVTRFVEALSDETKPGDTLTGLWKGTTKGGSTAFDTLAGNFSIEKGIVNIAKLDLDGPEASIATKGTVNLPAWTLSTAHTMTAKSKPDVPPFTMNISGPLDNPGQTFAQGAINDYLSRKIERKIGRELEKVLGDKLGLPPAQPQEVAPSGGAEPQDSTAPPPQQQQPQTPEDALRGVLEGILSR